MYSNEILISHRCFADPLTIPFKTHAHDKWELLWIVRGNPICMVEGKRYAVEEKTLLVFKPAQVHRVYTSQNQAYEYISLMCEETALPSALAEYISGGVGIFQFKNADTIYKLFLELHQQTENMGRAHGMKKMLDQVFENLQVDEKPTLLSEDKIVKAAMSYIEDNIHDIVRVKTICDAVGVTKETLYSHFIRTMLISPMKYVWAKKAAIAKIEISNQEHSLEILDKYGFKNKTAFLDEYASFYKSIP